MAARPTLANTARRRDAHIASSSADAVSIIITSDGMATRRSDIRNVLRPCTVPVMPSSANVVSNTGILASQGEMYPKTRAHTAAGIISWVRGTTTTLEGNPMVVARWK